jgi:hypothetical protein
MAGSLPGGIALAGSRINGWSFHTNPVMWFDQSLGGAPASGPVGSDPALPPLPLCRYLPVHPVAGSQTSN